MNIKFVKRGSRPGEATVNISRKARTVSFTSGFFKKYLKERRPDYIREGMDEDVNKIAIEFCDEKDNSGELFKLSYTKSGNAAAAVIRQLVNDLDIDINDIAGIYSGDAIEGPIKLDDSDREVFLLSIDKRQVK